VTVSTREISGGHVWATCISFRKGTPKKPVDQVRLIAGHGIEGDAHAGGWHRQVSLLEQEQVERMREKGIALDPGAFGENIVTRRFDLGSLEVGHHLRIGNDVVLRVTQRGKVCHTRCAIYFQTGDCIMPDKGVFARVRRGGLVRPGEPIAVDRELDRLRCAILALGYPAKWEGPAAICEMLDRALACKLICRRALPAGRSALLHRELPRLSDEDLCDLVVTMGLPQSHIPSMIERWRPGLTEEPTDGDPGCAPLPGQQASTVIVNLSASPRAACEQLEVLLPALPGILAAASGIPRGGGRRDGGARPAPP
jgi:MOSC domain-containing protein YiiM